MVCPAAWSATQRLIDMHRSFRPLLSHTAAAELTLQWCVRLPSLLRSVASACIAPLARCSRILLLQSLRSNGVSGCLVCYTATHRHASLLSRAALAHWCSLSPVHSRLTLPMRTQCGCSYTAYGYTPIASSASPCRWSSTAPGFIGSPRCPHCCYGSTPHSRY